MRVIGEKGIGMGTGIGMDVRTIKQGNGKLLEGG